MVKRELKSRKKKTSNATVDHSQDLFVCFRDVINKRRELLKGLKVSLLAQEEIELVSSLRKERFAKLEETKRELAKINSDYVKLQKAFPSVKGVISFAEKEISELHSQIKSLATEKRITEKELEEAETLSENLEDSEAIDEHLIEKRISRKVHGEKEKSTHKKTTPKKQLSKLDRIKNNLSIIEDKLKDL